MLPKSSRWIQKLTQDLFTKRPHRRRKSTARDTPRARSVVSAEALENRALLTTLINQDFEAFAGGGFDANPAAGQLDSDEWRVTGLSDGNGTFGGTHASGDFARGASNGGVSGGGFYGFDTDSAGTGDVILGVQPTGSDFTPGTITLRVENTTGSAVDAFDISYDIAYLNNATRANSLNFSFSTDDISYTDVSTLDFTTPEANDSDGWQSVDRSTTVNTTVAAGGFLYLQWSSADVSGGGSRDEFGLNNVLVETAAGGASLAIAADDAEKAEGNTGTTDYTFTVTRSDDTTGATDVDWAVTGAASNGADDADFGGTFPSGTVSFAANETTKTISVSASGDTDWEADNGFVVTLSNPTGGASLISSTANGTILNDDALTVMAPYLNNFESGLGDGWAAYSVDADTANTWEPDTNNGDGVAAVNAFGASAAGDDWLISPLFDLDATTNELLTFDTWTRFADGDVSDDPEVRLRYSTNYSGIGDPNAAGVTWTELSYNAPAPDSQTVTHSGNIDVSGIAGTGVTFAFQYTSTGTGGGSTSSWQVDDFSVQGSTGDPGITVIESAGSTDVEEGGATDTFDISLDTLPTSDVTVTVTPDDQTDLGSGAGVAISLTFTTATGTDAQTVTVTAVDDSDIEGDHTSTITITSSSTDGDYNGLTAGPVTANITDNDNAAPLSVGDISIIGFRADADDGFSFATWVELPNSTELNFWDYGYQGGGDGTGEGAGGGIWRTSENFMTWTNNTGSPIAAGTVITVSAANGGETDLGSVSGILGGLSSGGDQIFAGQGSFDGTTFNGTLLFGIDFFGTAGWDGDNTDDSNESALPSVLDIAGANISFDHLDNIQYTGDRVVPSLATGQTNVQDPANYTGDDDGATFGALDSTDFSVGSDTTPPSVDTLSPADDSNHVFVSTNLEITFDEAVVAGTGVIEIHLASDDSVVESIDINSAAVTFNGPTVTIDPTADLAFSTDYYVTIAAGVIEDAAANDFAGILTASDWNFSTSAASTLTTGDIAFTALNADGDDDFAFVLLTDVPEDERILFIDEEWDGSAFGTGEGELVWIAPAGGLTAGTVVVLNTVDATPTASVGSVSGGMGFSQTDEGVFAITGSRANPGTFLSAFSAKGDTGFASLAGTGLTLGTNAIDFLGTSGESHDILVFNGARDDQASFAAYAAVINDPANWLTEEGTDVHNNGIGPDLPFDDTVFTISTDSTPPVVTTLLPTDDATDVSVTTDLEITFDENVQKGIGNIVIRLLADNTAVQTIDVTDAAVTIVDATATIDITDLANGTGYYVEVDAGAFEDIATNDFAGITGNSTWNFSTSALPEFAIAATDATKNEGDASTTSFTFTVTRSGNTSGAASMTYTVTGSGTDAAAADDFDGATFPTGTVSFADGETSQVVTINVAGDTDFEADEGFTVTLSDLSVGGSFTTDAADGLIQNDDPQPQTLIISEIMYNPSSSDGNWEWVEVYNTTGAAITVDGWVIDDGNNTTHTTANIASGTVAAGGTGILFNVDEVSAAEFSAAWGSGLNLIPVTNWAAMGLNNGGDTVSIWSSFADYDGDHLDLNNEVISVTYSDDAPWPADDSEGSIYLTDLMADPSDGANWALSTVGASTPAGGDAYTSRAAAGNSGADIGSPGGEFNDLTVVIAAAEISEAAGAAATTVEITRGGDLTNPVVVTLASDDSTEATIQSTVTIPANTATVTINLDAVDDALVDGTQTVTISASATGLTDGADTVDVTDNEQLELTVDIASSTIAEDAGAVATTGTVTRNGDTSAELTVTLSVDDLSEAAVPATIVIPAGEASVTFNIDAVDDAELDGTQTVLVTATATGFSDGSAGLDVTDNEFVATDYILNELMFNPDGSDTSNEYIELRGTPDGFLPSDVYIALIEGDANSQGDLDGLISLAGLQFGSNGYLNLVQTGNMFSTDAGSITSIESFNLENGSFSVLLIETSTAPSTGTDFDTNDDGELDGAAASWIVIDGYGNIDGGADDTAYGLINTSGNGAGSVPAGSTFIDLNGYHSDYAGRIGDSIGATAADWVFAEIAGAAPNYTLAEFDFVSPGHLAGAPLDHIGSTNLWTPPKTLTVEINEAEISENGGSSSITLTRTDGDISSALVVNLSSDDTSEATVPASVTIPAGQATVTFNVDAVDDAIVDGTQTVTISATSTGFSDGTDTVDVTDDDSAALSLTISDASISESGGTTTATVTRNTDTTTELVVTLASDDTSEATVPATVTIPAGQASVTFNIDGVDDAIVDGTQTATISASASGLADGTDTVDVTDDDTAALTLTIADASISENGGTTTGTVSRNTDTTTELVVTLASDDTSEASVPATVTIPAGQATVTFNVDAVDDALVDGTLTVTILAEATSFVDGSNSVAITDDDSAGFTITETDGDTAVSEDGTTDTFYVVLTGAPVTPVVLTVASSDTGEVTASPATLTFDSSNWNSPQTITVTGVDDSNLDGPQTANVTVAVDPAASDDAFDALANQTVSVNNADNERLTASISAVNNGNETESTAGVFRIQLSETTPTDLDVAYSLGGTATNGDDYAALSGTITVSAGSDFALLSVDVIDDVVDETTETVVATLTEGSVDVDPTNDSASLLILDNDTSDLIVSRTNLSVSEDGTSETFEVTLTSQPTADVIVTITPSDASEAAVDVSTLTFTSSNWNQPQIVTVTGVDDADVDGPVDSLITVATDGAAPGNFAAADDVTVSVSTADNDSAAAAPTINRVTFYNKSAEAEQNLSANNTGQRSMIRRVQVVLDGDITITSATGFSPMNTSTNTAVSLDFISSTIVGGQTFVVLEFTSGLDAGSPSLADGFYNFSIDGAATGIDASGSGSAGGSASYDFHRMFGDSDGDRDVDGLDFGNYRRAIYGISPLDSVFDFDDDGQLFRDLDDLSAFRNRYGRRL